MSLERTNQHSPEQQAPPVDPTKDPEEPKQEHAPDSANSCIVTLASGCQVELRKVTIADENYMANAKRGKKRRAMELALQEVLSRCTLQVVDPGPYAFLEAGGRPDWGKMLSGDRIWGMFELRRLTYKQGLEYVVENVTCGCTMVWDHAFDIDKDLHWKRLPESSVPVVRAAGTFEITIDGRKVQFVLQNGETEDVYDRLRRQHPDRKMAAALRSRIKDVGGIDRREIMDWLDGDDGKSKKHSGLSSDDAEELRAAFEEVDCGVDMEVEAECPDCGRFVRFALPFDSMFLPGRKVRDRKRKHRGTEFSVR